MKCLPGYRMKLVFVGFVAAIVLGGGSVKADFTFGEPTNLGPAVNFSWADRGARLSTDGLKLYFDSERPGGYGVSDIWLTTRETEDDDWLPPVNLGPNVNSMYHEMDVNISADGLSLYFASNRPGGYGDYDIWVSTRNTTSDPWSEAVNLGSSVCTPSRELGPSISSDDLSLYFQSDRPDGLGGRDLWVTVRAKTSDPWGPAVNLGPTVNTSSADKCPGITTDGLTLIFSSDRPGKYSSPYDL